MKIIEFPYEKKEERLPGGSNNVLPLVKLMPETSLVRAGEPLFLPGWYPEWVGDIYMGIVIAKLGRCIDIRFAQKYIASHIIAVHARPADKNIYDGATSAAVAGCDGCVLRSTPLDRDSSLSVQVEELYGKATLLQRELNTSVYDADEVSQGVHLASLTFTLHTGDIILSQKIGSIPLTPETRITILNDGGNAVMSHKIK